MGIASIPTNAPTTARSPDVVMASSAMWVRGLARPVTTRTRAPVMASAVGDIAVLRITNTAMMVTTLMTMAARHSVSRPLVATVSYSLVKSAMMVIVLPLMAVVRPAKLSRGRIVVRFFAQ